MPPALQVAEGDIATFKGDAVVNAANNHLRMGTGVAGALLRDGGWTIQEECDDYVRRHGPLKVGQAAVTGAGNLKVRYVIHAAAMGDEPVSHETIRNSTRHALLLAQESGVKTLALPVLGTGVAGFPFEEAARLMVEEVRAIPEEGWGIESIVFYGYTPDQATALRRLIS
jgi:O-acetyl-ADP-ribose deacetylase (regulator of RNase III)